MGVSKMLKRLLYRNIVLLGSKAIGILAPLTIPPLHIAFLYYFWQEYARDVDKQYCSCSCWDTVFKGSYESGIASYKHMYFNATMNSLKIWITIVIGIVTFYETVKYLIWLAFQQRLRFSMMLLFSTAVFSHYYSWWVYINYWNDDFYSQWYHQLFFSITELMSTFLVVHLADKKTLLTNKKAFAIITIAVLHIVAGGWDQFVENVVRGEGYAHQVVRDLGFMIPDILHVAVPLWSMQWRNACNLPGSSTRDSSVRRDLAYMLGMTLIGLCVCAIL
ncbi:uncharacterized protein V1478_003924 [Vespula squamosa]|uniref:Uncharacterized protein n=1 Tax=Vespula squamosa TaxID=30214 RepID=A0ABD2BN86_VESSQ